MAFQLPTFNLTSNIWRATSAITDPPDLTSMCQLRAAGKQSTGQDPFNFWVFLWAGLFPALTDIRDGYTMPGQDTVEIPAGSGRYYAAQMVDDVAKGFANEYRIAFISKATTWPHPIP